MGAAAHPGSEARALLLSAAVRRRLVLLDELAFDGDLDLSMAIWISSPTASLPSRMKSNARPKSCRIMLGSATEVSTDLSAARHPAPR
jgi:hypothetical protein